MTHVPFGWSHLQPIGQLTNTRYSDGVPDPDGDLKTVVRSKVHHDNNLYLNRSGPIDFIPLTVDTTGCLYDDFFRLFFLYTHRESSVLTNELPEVSDQFRFIRTECFTNLKVLLVWSWWKCRLCGFQFLSTLSRFIRSCRPTPLLDPFLVLFPPCST